MKNTLFAAGVIWYLLFSRIASGAEAAPGSVDLHWLDSAPPPVAGGVSWGVPWPRGTVQKTQSFSLSTADGKSLPLQTWPLAYWPDGSLKWSGFATTSDPSEAGSLKLSLSAAAPSQEPQIHVTNDSQTLVIDTGAMICRISPNGPNIVDSMEVDGRVVANNGQLVCILQNGPDDAPEASPKREKFISLVKKVTLEQSGPVRAVVKIEGVHKGAQSGREWLPFVVRLYFYAGETSARMVHTFIYDGDQTKDFVRGLGVTFSIAMREQVQNRHIRFSGEDDGLWAEPVQPLIGRNGGGGGYSTQVQGQRVPDGDSPLAVWSDFKLSQPTADGFTISKRTNPQSTWVYSEDGKRSTGLVFAGDVSGGLAASLKNFWQSYPAELEVRNAGLLVGADGQLTASTQAQLTVWMWSPEAPAMDMRHYDIWAHDLNASYEDVQAGPVVPGASETPTGMATAYGIARTSELTLYATADVPAKADLSKMAQTGTKLPLLAVSPEYLHATNTLGIWALPDSSTPFKKAIEDRLSSTLDFYAKQVDERGWYGFWNFGDVMHSYDAVRHVWRYDVGGYAWDNTELGTVMWLWYSYMRTGEAGIFRRAEGLTRAAGEVDCYHIGPMAGLGSRHNVVHWGDGAKEARISQAAHWQYYYFLTTDERTGDLMHEAAVNSPIAMLKYDPMREAQAATDFEKSQFPTRIRSGPDWLAIAGDWMIEWERTGDVKWRDLILSGVNSMAEMPYWFRTGRNLVMGFDPATGKLFSDAPNGGQPPIGDYNLATIQGGAEVAFDLYDDLGSDAWRKMWMQYCRIENAPMDMILQDKISGDQGADASYARNPQDDQGTPRLAGFVYMKTGNTAFAQRAINWLASQTRPVVARQVSGPEVLHPVDESQGVSTNDAAQSGLKAIEILQMCADQLPTEVPVATGRGGFRGGPGGRGN